MKIVSKFKDYYDSGQAFGQDPKRVYLRETRIETLKLDNYYHRGLHVIGFCGQLYPFINKIECVNKYKKNRNAKYYTLYDNDMFNISFDNIKDECIRVKFDEKIDLSDSGKRYWFSKTIKQEFETLQDSSQLNDLFVKYKTPIFHYNALRKENIIINPNLKDLAFFKVKDTIQAYQEIEQFISNELANETHIDVPVGNDEVIGTSKGFDRYSFRNAKKKPKKF